MVMTFEKLRVITKSAQLSISQKTPTGGGLTPWRLDRGRFEHPEQAVGKALLGKILKVFSPPSALANGTCYFCAMALMMGG